MPLKINGATSGSVTLAAPATGSDVTLTLPGTSVDLAAIPQANVTNLTSDLAAKLPIAGGKVLQIVEGTSGASTNTTSTTYVNTNQTVTITPSASSSKVLIIAWHTLIRGAVTFASTTARIYRGTVTGTALGGEAGLYMSDGAQYDLPVVQVVMDAPSTTSAQTYTVALKSSSAGHTATIAPQRIFAMEVSA